MGARRNSGLAWQAVLDAFHDDYRRDSRAFVVRANPPVRVLGRPGAGGVFRATWAGDGPPDYLGMLAPDGRAVVFDAKNTLDERWAFANLERHQARDLEAGMNRGAFSFLAIRTGLSSWVVPWDRLRESWWAWFTDSGRAASGAASLGTDDLDRLGTRMRVPGDWLSILRPG